MSPTTEDKIYRIVSRSSGISAMDIANMLGLERNTVNSILYKFKGMGIYSVDVDYKWTLKENRNLRNNSTSERSKIVERTNINNNIGQRTTTPTIEKKFIPKDNKVQSVSKDLQSRKKMKQPREVPYRPKSYNPDDLFEYAVKHLAEHSQTHDDTFSPKIHNQWCNRCFGYPGITSGRRSEFMSSIKSEYGAYFLGRLTYTFDIGAIERDFPQFFSDYVEEDDDIISEVVKAVNSELDFARKPQNKEKYKVSSIVREDIENKIYNISLEINDDDEPHFYEGIKISLHVNGEYFSCKGLDYDIATATLSVSSDKELICGDNLYGQITLDTSFILEAVAERVKRMEYTDYSGLPIDKFLEYTTDELSDIEVDENLISSFKENLDDSQKDAFDATMNHDITFIWGPPGTGKSFTLAYIIRALFALSDNTVVCCISNVAVDQLLNKVVDILDMEGFEPNCGNFYRAGYTTDHRLIETNYLFPEDDVTLNLRAKISSINLKLKELQSLSTRDKRQVEELRLKNERLDLREKLKTHTDFLIDSSKVVFTTIAGFILNRRLCDRNFDNLIVDEASMLSMPYLFAIAQKIFKRIILVGDPQQLGPISITPNNWLKENVFDYSEVLEGDHPALKQLLNQRRSHPSIVKLTNDVFYLGKLISKQDKHPAWVENGPFAGKVVVSVNPQDDDNQVKYVGTTRRNFGTKAAVMDILKEYSSQHNRSFSIGIITPYRAQVKMYMAAIRDMYDGSGFWEKIKVGTIHTFQGSECDLIILDIVEKSPVAVSRLFDRSDGERLVNVALSRARNKLIVVGDTKRFNGGAGIAKVSLKVCKVLSNLR